MNSFLHHRSMEEFVGILVVVCAVHISQQWEGGYPDFGVLFIFWQLVLFLYWTARITVDGLQHIQAQGWLR
jgi:hypothetical protein